MMRAIQDSTLGPLEWDEAQFEWRGSLILPSGRLVHLLISPQTAEHAERPDAPEVFEAVYPLVAWLRKCEAEVSGAVAGELLGLYNGTWSEEPPISAAEFARRIELVDAIVPSNGEHVNLWFTDGEMEMFGGHMIDAYFGADGRLQSAHLSG
jgi:hypothetical protein